MMGIFKAGCSIHFSFTSYLTVRHLVHYKLQGMITNLLLFCIGITVNAREFPLANTGFDLKGKVGLIAGGVGGIGFAIASELLAQGVKGVTLVDINVEKGRNVAKQLNEEFGYGRVIFVPADVGDLKQFEGRDAFKVTQFYWKGLDIFVNGAGIHNEREWKSLISTNVIGSLQGTLLGFKYMSTANGQRGRVLINISSTSSLEATSSIYGASKSFMTTLGRALGEKIYYNHNGVRTMTICPGPTDTDLLNRLSERISNEFSPLAKSIAAEALKGFIMQPPSNVAQAVILMIKYGSNGGVWVSEDNEAPYEVIIPHRRAMRRTG